jgi:hypothetical protein
MNVNRGINKMKFNVEEENAFYKRLRNALLILFIAFLFIVILIAGTLMHAAVEAVKYVL